MTVAATTQSTTSDRGARCTQCGCDSAHPCVDVDLIPCHWHTPTLCSHCHEDVPAFKPGMKLYEAMRFEESLSVIVRRLVMGQESGRPCIETEITEGLARRPELVTDVPGEAAEIAGSILADCFTDAIAIELGGLLALSVIRPLLDEKMWWMNEFQLRRWIAENKVPY